MDDARKNEILAVIFFALTLFLFLSVFTFTEQDLSFYTSDSNVILHNLAGVVGAYVSGFFIFLLGKGAYVIPLLTLAWGLSRLFQFEPRKVFFKVFGTIFLVTAVSASMSLASYSTRTLAFSRGGLVGTIVSEFLMEYLGKAGAVLVISATIILSILIATEFLLLPILMGVFKFFSDLYAKTFPLPPERLRTFYPVSGKDLR